MHRLRFVVVDDRGREFETSLDGRKAVELERVASVPLTQSLRPGDSYETTLVFDLPVDIANPRLLVRDFGFPNFVLISHENSFFHEKIFFSLDESASQLSASAARGVGEESRLRSRSTDPRRFAGHYGLKTNGGKSSHICQGDPSLVAGS